MGYWSNLPEIFRTGLASRNAAHLESGGYESDSRGEDICSGVAVHVN